MKPSFIATLLSAVFAVAASGVGFVAAWYWKKASEIPIDPGWNSGEPGDTRNPEPADLEGIGRMAGWLDGTMLAVTQSADLNRTAALWTARSVALAACSGVFAVVAVLL